MWTIRTIRTHDESADLVVLSPEWVGGQHGTLCMTSLYCLFRAPALGLVIRQHTRQHHPLLLQLLLVLLVLLPLLLVPLVPAMLCRI